MAKTVFADVPPAQKVQVMLDNCDGHEKTSYLKDLSNEELDIKRETLTSNCIRVFKLEEEKKDVVAGFKAQIDPLKDETRMLCEQVETRKEQVSGMLFHFADHEASVMNTYDELGEFVSSRRLKPEEKQARLFIATGGKMANGE